MSSMGSFLAAAGAAFARFAATPLGAFTVDIVDAAVLGAAIAAYGLPDNIPAKDAVGLIAGAAVGSVKGAARFALAQYIAGRTAKAVTPAP